MISNLDPYIDCLLSGVGPTLEHFRDHYLARYAPLAEWLVKFDSLMDWVEEHQLACAVTFEHIGHGPGTNPPHEQVVHIRLLLIMDEKTATVFRLYYPDEKPEQLERHWKERPGKIYGNRNN
jgi:hypothetical protein